MGPVAVMWYTLTAEQGNAEAQHGLCLMYQNGLGVPRDYVYAYMWAQFSAQNGHEDGIRLRDYLEARMTRFEIQRAEKLARECVKKNYKGC